MSTKSARIEQEKEHAAFKQRLVDEVLGQDTDDSRVPMEKVVMLIWMFRQDPSVVTFMARFVSKYAGSRHVLDGIEFYLPQLAHMIIHLEVEWDDAILERFALFIAQHSMHFALQLNWILQGALQDYQPELSVDGIGSPNPNYNPLFYSRCLLLLKNVERCVVYGKPRAQELQRLYETGKITKREMHLLEQADRRFNALQIVSNEQDANVSVQGLDGWLYVLFPSTTTPTASDSNKPQTEQQQQQAVTSNTTTSDNYQHCYCVLEKKVLNCYTTKNCCSSKLKLDRAMSLERADVDVPEQPQNDENDNMTIHVQTKSCEFWLKCSSPEERNLWLRRLREEADASALFQPHRNASINKDSSDGEQQQLQSNSITQDLTPAQLNRYEFFQNERDFVSDLTDIAEELRFEDRAERKKLAPGKMAELEIPKNVYLPLCNSSDVWRRVGDKLPDETRVFNTKERCPTVMNFVARRGETREKGGRLDVNVDVAEYMHNHFEVVAEMEDVDEEEKEEEEEAVKPETPDPIKHSDHSGVWEDDVNEDEPPNSTLTTPSRGRPRGNRRVQRLLKESVVVLPTKLAKQLTPKAPVRNRISVMDRQTEMQPAVPILEGKTNGDVAAATAVGDDDSSNVSAVSIERGSSVLIKDHIVKVDFDVGGDIDLESINRAKKYVCGGESWADKTSRMLESARKESEKQGDNVQLEIVSCVSKSYDDLRQEVFVMQMIHYYKSVFAQAKLPIWLKTYRILSTSSQTGLLELLTDATSIDGLKKAEGFPKEEGLRKYFEMVYGGPDSKAFKAAQTNFMQSLVGYSLVSYLLGLKDRHNGNIMIDTRGHLIFIDFGFAMGMKPGHEFSFERAPFKLTKEYIEVIGGIDSDCYKEFQRLFVAGFEEARKNSQIALGLVEIMMYKSNYPCFSGWRYGKGRALREFERRLMLRTPDNQVKKKALRLIRKSRRSTGTYLYDLFQNKTNGYAM